MWCFPYLAYSSSFIVMYCHFYTVLQRADETDKHECHKRVHETIIVILNLLLNSVLIFWSNFSYIIMHDNISESLAYYEPL